MKKIEKAWMLYLSSIENISYLYMIISIYKQLKDTNTKYPIYCGVTNKINESTRSILEKIGLNLLDLDTSQIEKASIIKNNDKNNMCIHYKDALTKLAILNSNIEEKFDKIVYIDSDYLVYENMDELFDKPHMSAVEDQAPWSNKISSYHEGKSVFCSGLFVWDFKNNPGKGVEIVESLSKLNPTIAWHDQNILNFHYQNWRLNPELHLSAMYGLMNGKKEDDAYTGKVKARHMVCRIRKGWPNFNPWELNSNERKNYRHQIEYFTRINEIIKYYNENFNLNLRILNLNNLPNNNDISDKVIVAKEDAFTGLTEEWWKEEY